jgi:hypothetical protein
MRPRANRGFGLRPNGGVTPHRLSRAAGETVARVSHRPQSHAEPGLEAQQGNVRAGVAGTAALAPTSNCQRGPAT